MCMSAKCELRTSGLCRQAVSRNGSGHRSASNTTGCFAHTHMSVACRVLEFGPDQGLQGQVVDIVRLLLDTESTDQSPEKDPFLELFYDKYVGELIHLLIEGAEQNQQQSQEQLDAFRRQEEVHMHACRLESCRLKQCDI